MVRRPGPRRFVPRRLLPGLWVVATGRAPQYRTRQVGRPEARTQLVYDEGAARAHMRTVQAGLGRFLSAEMTVWMLDRLAINCVLDVGANVGQYARRLRNGGYQGRIVSFEPVPDFAARLRRRAGKDPAWHVHELALGEAEATAEIHVTPGRTLSSLLPASDFGKKWSSDLREPQSHTIQVRRLDGVLDEAVAGIEHPRIFLKLDTQGFDLPAFRGAGDRLPEILGLQSEVACLPLYEGMPLLEEQLGEYRAAGFDLVGMYPVSRQRFRLGVIEYDALMVRPRGT
ncbi:MAG TPA: FkbM family methyltransferase [Nocardioides sp.]|uniref:FkbM family methyltransferase n=1 Tax=Nocardioides sp. TaxID=35761 RepID=UPI002C2250CA|nr:FkbM family methyltransferase [Nocardioides sp.]HQR26666.1 FkbM family methyltransferase [Nocardioides sp.]